MSMYLEPHIRSAFHVDEGNVKIAGTFWHRVRTRMLVFGPPILDSTCSRCEQIPREDERWIVEN